MVTGRVSALALDPADLTGNRLYLGTTGGGVWAAENAGAQNTSSISFISLNDSLATFTGAEEASLSIGALAVQPGGTGVILAGTGDPNDVLDSYYGAGILRSTDNGSTWTLIQTTADQLFSFIGEGFAGIAFSTANPQLVVAAVSQAWEGVAVDAVRQGLSYEGLYYSIDGGASWTLATIEDGTTDVQGMGDLFDSPDGNAATSVVWNPVRQLFIAAVRFHGYYQSGDGITWTRLTAQPGSNLSTTLCPPSQGAIGSIACPIYRGTLAVNPMTGDTFAWTVDLNLQDQGIWQDQCGVSADACTNKIAFAKQWNTAQLETDTLLGAATIENGDYNLVLAAVPAGLGAGEDTVMLAGANDLWKCSLAMGCAWRNTTNADTCMSAKVAAYQHALAWNPGNPLEIFVGNDSGIWRSTDGIGETGQVCAASDAAHFQNLNGGLGSLAEVESLAQSTATPYTMMAGLGSNGTAGVKGNSPTPGDWPMILSGEGGPVAIDANNSSKWYANNEPGVSIYACDQATACTPTAFGTTPVVTDADVGGDGLTMPTPAPFLVDPLDSSQLLVGTCRVWRGAADGLGWSATDAISPILDGGVNTYCDGDALIRSMAAMELAGGTEVVYVGTYGSANGGSNLPGHVLSAIVNPSSSASPIWNDLTLNPVTNSSQAMNYYGLDISSIAIDTHDATGNTVYVTVAGFASPTQEVEVVYRSTDGGSHWAYLTSNLPPAPVNGLVVDPEDACTVYIATDVGVYSTRNVASCASPHSTCWSAFGAGLPLAPVVELRAAPATATAQLLTAATYGRGIWQTPEWTAGTQLTSATASPDSLSFATQTSGNSSTPQPVTVTNSGRIVLTIAAISIAGDSDDFSATGCASATLQPGDSCTVQVTFTPTAAGARGGTLTVAGNISCGDLTVALSGTGVAPPVSVTPSSIAFGGEPVKSSSGGLPVTVANSTTGTVTFTSPFAISGPFTIASNTCTGGSLAASASCVLSIEFSPVVAGAATGDLSFTYQAGTQTGKLTVVLSGTGQAVATDTLSATALAFPSTVEGQLSAPLTFTMTNSGDVPLKSISVSASTDYKTSNDCGAELAADSGCTISVVFNPSQAGSQPGTLSVADSARTQTVSLSGVGLLPPIIAVSPDALNFAAQSVSQASAPALLTVSNSGGAPMANVGFQFMGPAAASFSTGVITCGATLKNGSSCTAQVLFTPAVTGGSAATLVVSSSTNDVAAVSVPISGTGIAPNSISVTPTQLTFPIVAPGKTAAPQGVYITNTGGASLSSIKIVPGFPFSLVANSCTGALEPESSCSAGVVFAPNVPASFNTTLTISSPSLKSKASVALSGIGGTPGMVDARPGLVTFPVTGLGSTSSPVTVTLTNPSPVTKLTNLQVKGTGAFHMTGGSCSTTLAALKSCTAEVVFSPLSAGPQTGGLAITSDELAAPESVPLQGVGFDFKVTAGILSQTVSNGQTGIFPLSFELVGQSKEAVLTLSCESTASFPPNATCNFNPSANPKVPATATGSASVEVATGQAANTRSSAVANRWRLLPPACGLLLLPLALARRSRALLLATLLVVLAGGVTSCTESNVISGGTLARSGSNTTPAATYQVTVDVLSNNVKHTVTLTLIVD